MAAGDRILEGLITDEVAQARAGFVAAVERAMIESDLDPDQIEGRLSALVSSIWNDLEEKARRLPHRDRRRGPRPERQADT